MLSVGHESAISAEQSQTLQLGLHHQQACHPGRQPTRFNGPPEQQLGVEQKGLGQGFGAGHVERIS